MTLARMLGSRPVTRTAIASHLDSLNAANRTIDCLSLSREELKRLWELAAADPGESQDLLGESKGSTFDGRNSLRLLTRFEKHFVRQEGMTVGYNHHRLSWLIGPGYFTVTAAPRGLLFDYNRIPDHAPQGWPRVTPNTRSLARPVYGGLQDDAVWVAHDVLIGSARRGNLSLDSYFVLARR